MDNARNQSSFAGKARLVNSPNHGGEIVFADEAGVQTKTLMLDPSSAHALEIHTAAACDFTVSATRSSPEAISQGRAIWGAASNYSDRDGDLFLGDAAAGITAVKVTCSRDAAANAAEAEVLGGLAVVRATKIDAVTSGETALFAVTRTEMAVDA